MSMNLTIYCKQPDAYLAYIGRGPAQGQQTHQRRAPGLRWTQPDRALHRHRQHHPPAQTPRREAGRRTSAA
jgi:hypothetical protein